MELELVSRYVSNLPDTFQEDVAVYVANRDHRGKP